MKSLLTMLALCCLLQTKGQELYVYTEPASNVPARSLSFRSTGNFITSQRPYYRFMQRYTPTVMAGLSKKWMVSVGGTFADMHTSDFRWESVYVYSKFRVLSSDQLHSHFRMAVFAEGAYTRSPFHFDEINLNGDKDGVQVGVVATQLWHRLALSGTVSHTQVLHASRENKAVYDPPRSYEAMNYSLSAGYLILPVEYTDYKQTNLNVYTEILAQQTLDRKGYYVDVAPAVQLIFNSNTKVNLGYRFQLDGNMQRMARNSWQVTLERTLLNVF